MDVDLSGRVAVVAGATRGAGRGIAVELGARGATVWCTGRTTREQASPMGRAETIEETAELVDAAGGQGIAMRVDHADPEQVAALAARIDRVDVLVNDIWGGDPLTYWDGPFWEHPLDDGLALLHGAVDTHLITAWHLLPKLAERGLHVEVTDSAEERYRGSLFYDLAKASAIRIAVALAAELRPRGATALALTPGFLRSEAVLDHFGVTADRWRDAIAQDEHFAYSETPHFVGRAVAALAADPDVARHAGRALTSWDLAREYGFDDIDGTRPDWGAHWVTLNVH
jgi:NAD(P)-dependent dehydrogenase (short-subunit alcohol dehydrogenase family)